MEFVNSIAKIVHMEVSLHGGAANKNIGDAFLLVWKFPRHARASSRSAQQQQQPQPQQQTFTALETSPLLAAKCVPAHRTRENYLTE